MKDTGNRRPERRPPRVKGRKTAEIKPSVPSMKQTKPDMLATKNLGNTLGSIVNSEVSTYLCSLKSIVEILGQ